MLRSLLVFLALLSLLSSCRSYDFSVKALQKHFPEPTDSSEQDSALRIIKLRDSKNRIDSIVMDEKYSVEVLYYYSKIFQIGHRVVLDPYGMYCDSTQLVSSESIRTGIFSRNRGHVIPLNKLERASLKNISRLDNRFCIKFPPLAMLDPYGGNSCRLGAEAKLYRNFSVAAEAGTFLPYGLAAITNVRGYLLKPELKYYCNRKGRTTGPYLSLEYTYRDFSFNMSDSLWSSQTKTVIEKEYRIHKNVQCASIKYGRLYVHDKHFVFDWHVGAGIRYISAYSDLTAAESNSILTGEGHGGVITALLRSTGNFQLPNLTAGFKIGWKIW